MKKGIVAGIIVLSIIGFIGNMINVTWLSLILGISLLYITYEIAIKKNLSFANLVVNSANPTQTDKNLGTVTSVIALIIGLYFLFFSIYSFFIN